MEDSSSKTTQIRAMAWDPSSPATLQLPTTAGTSAEDFRVDSTLSHDGVGCNPHEASALMNILDARDAYQQSTASDSDTVCSISRAYRKALCDCVEGWESELGNREDEVPVREQENLDLLKITFAVTHLSEAFLLTPNLAGVYYDNPSSLPGAVTAETVRYLRLHHMTDPTSVCDEALLDDLENSIQPDQLDDGEPYWNLLQSFLVRGCLNDVWALLSRHSIHRQAQQALTVPGMDEYQAATLAQDLEGFRALEALLLSAPLPGGRTDEYDADFLVQEPEEGETMTQGLIEGIPPLAFRLWEASPDNRRSGDFPISFQPNAALQVYRSWQQAVKAMPEVQNLKRRIPPLQKVLAILSGDFSEIVFESWAEELCAELLYRAPNLRLADMHIRASRIMEKYGQGESDFFNEVVLSVMRGNAGRVVEVLHELGGGSGAALPAVMVSTSCLFHWILTLPRTCCFSLFMSAPQTSLLCNLLDDVGVIPKFSTDYSIQTELLLNAAFAIRSSFAAEGQSDLGIRMVVRLLLPHIKVNSDVAITASMVDALEHHYPQTDAEATALLDLCRKLVVRKNVRVLDGCIGICLARYRYFLSDERPGGAVHWLLTGMDMEALCLHGPNQSAGGLKAVSTGVCHRLLVTICMQTAESLLKGLLGGGEGVSLVYASGKEMVVACEESDMAVTVPAVKVLEHVVAMAEAVAERKDDALVATSIVACLEEHPNEEGDGEVSCLARPTMHWDLIRLAKVILDRNTEREAMDELHLHAASFDVRGMQVLLEKLTLILATHEMMGQPGPPREIVQQTRLAFAEGLMRAFVAENAMKQSKTTNRTRSSLAGIYAANLGRVSRETQELVVNSMLNY
jgi:hypothetical protein